MYGKTQVVIDIDYEKPGKQHGYLHVPHSDNDAAWANILIPITVVKNGDGPTLLAVGGVHGDEFEGPVVLMKLARNLKPEQVHGRVIILPALNLPALQAGMRLSPIDGKNLNRAFPGTFNDTTTGLIAHYVTTVLFEMADIVVDIHSGGRSLIFLPVVHLRQVSNEAQFQSMLEAAKAWGTSHIWVYIDIAGEEGILALGPERKGKTIITTEMGGAGQCSPEVLRIAERGLKNVLIQQGLIDGHIENNTQTVQLLASIEREDYILALSDGIYESFKEVGEEVLAEEAIGQIHYPDKSGGLPEIVVARTSGILICRRFPGLVKRGYCVAVIARPIKELFLHEQNTSE